MRRRNYYYVIIIIFNFCYDAVFLGTNSSMRVGNNRVNSCHQLHFEWLSLPVEISFV